MRKTTHERKVCRGGTPPERETNSGHNCWHSDDLLVYPGPGKANPREDKYERNKISSMTFRRLIDLFSFRFIAA
jgi:hypothetical protein